MYPAPLLNSLIGSNILSVDSILFSKEMILSSLNNEGIICFPSFLFTFFFSYSVRQDFQYYVKYLWR